MSRKNIILTVIAVVIAAAVITLVIVLCIGANNGEQKEPLNPAPDFSVVDWSGNTVKLSELRGKPVVVNFFASWCYYCDVEMPDFQRMYEKYGDEVQFVMVDLIGGGETVEVGKKYIGDAGYSFPVYFDTMQEAASAYSISGIPNTYFINEDGEIEASVKRMITAIELEAKIKSLIE